MTDFPAIKRVLQEVGHHHRTLGLEDELKAAWAEYEAVERVRELEGALCAIETRLTAVDGVSLAQGHAAALAARELATAALGPKAAGAQRPLRLSTGRPE